MARKYAAEFKENIIVRMLPPRSESVPSISKETGISVNTLYTWQIQYRNNGSLEVFVGRFQGMEA